MTQEEITVLAGHRIVSPWVMKLCMDVAKAERESCAKLAQETICDTHIPTGVRIYGSAAAKAIRARGEA